MTGPNNGRPRGSLPWWLRAITPLLVLVALLSALPGVSAAQYSWSEAGGTISATHEIPDHPTPEGELFIVTGTAWGLTNAVDAVSWGDMRIVGSCTLIDDTVNTTTDNIATFQAVIRHDGGSCSWSRVAEALTGGGLTSVGETLGRVVVSGNNPSFTMTDVGQRPTEGAAGFFVPVLIVGGIFMYAFTKGLKNHPAWGLLLLVAFLGLLTVILGAAAVTGAAVPVWAVLVAAAVLVLSMYVVGGSGFSRSTERT